MLSHATKAVRLLTLGGLLVLFAGVHSASAQLANQVRFTTDFPFVAGNVTVPAGTYTLSSLSADPLVLVLKGRHVEAVMYSEPARSLTEPPTAEVQFARRGNTYVLAGAWAAGDMDGVETVAAEPSHVAMTLARASQHHVAPETAKLPADRVPTAR